ncbi:MAG: SusC/RagA family TonB-linked outer membrane protein [Prolixibacteraceae bacterium]
MRLTVFLLCVTMMSGLATESYSQATKLTVVLNNTSIENVLREIENQSGYRFFYNGRIDVEKRVSANFVDRNIDEVLDSVLEGTTITYEVVGRQIVLSSAEKGAAIQQPAQVSGKVTNPEGEPLPGVTVIVKGTTRGTTTDLDGNYVLPGIDPGETLVFSFVGMKSQEIPVAGKTQINITMEEEAFGLEEVVAIGYGEKRRVNMTGSVTSANSEVLESRPITNTVTAIQGVMPGLVVQRSSGQPGSESFDLRVRGITSTNGGNTPLIMVDGVAGDLNLLNPDDIESISVLKDASASIYGARAAGGVVLVTTKGGQKGAPKISYSTNFAVSELAGLMETPDHYQMAIMDNEANIHNGAAPMYTPDLLEKVRIGDPNPIPHPVYGSAGWMLFFTSTDWRNAVFENGFQQKHTVNVSGGGDYSSYYLSGTFSDQKGVIKYGDDNNKRYNLRMNYDYNFTKWLKLESKVAFENQNRTDIGGVGSAGIMYETIFGMPNHPIYTQSGEKYFAQGGWGNAVAQAKEGETATFVNRNFNTNFKLIAEVMKGLKINLQAGVNVGTTNSKDIANSHPLYVWDESAIAYYSIANPDQTYVNQSNSTNTYRNFTGYFQYNKTLNEVHKLDVMGGISHEENDFEEFSAMRTRFITDENWELGLGSSDNMSNDGGGYHWAIRSLFSRISYSFKDKYLLEANLRYDGSSRFDRNTRWGLFPGISLGWRISEEAFMQSAGMINDLKLRASYGETGNQDVIGYYDYYQLINVDRGYPYPFGPGGRDQSAYLSGMVSPDRTWETVAVSNIGLDATLLASSLDFSFDYFIKKNKDMLIPVTYPSMLGAIPPYSNAGELRTKGFETAVRYSKKIGEFSGSFRVTLSDAHDELTDYGGQDTYILGLNANREGYPVNTYFAYEFDGVIRTQEELDAYKMLGGVPGDIGIGDARFKDLDGDGNINIYSSIPGSDGDVKNVGSTTPRYTYGFNLDLKWKNFDLGIFVQGVGKRTLFRVGEYAMPWSDWWRQPPLFYFGNTWNEDRPDAKYPRLSHGNIRYWNYQPSTLQAVNAAYLRLKNLQIGYTLPASLLSKIYVKKARVYFSGFDLFEIHNVKGGWDPESSDSGFNYPFQRLYSVGLDLTF